MDHVLSESCISQRNGRKRTSDGGNGNPYNVDKNQNRSNVYIFIYKLAVGIYFMILRLISYFHECTALFGAKMITFCIIHIGNRKIFLKHHSPPSSN